MLCLQSPVCYICLLENSAKVGRSVVVDAAPLTAATGGSQWPCLTGFGLLLSRWPVAEEGAVLARDRYSRVRTWSTSERSSCSSSVSGSSNSTFTSSISSCQSYQQTISSFYSLFFQSKQFQQIRCISFHSNKRLCSSTVYWSTVEQ